MRLDGKRVLVVGGSSGIGLAVARRVLDEGGQAILMSRSAQKLAAANGTLGDRAETVACDASDERAVGQALQALSSLDHVVTTAAELTFAPFAEQSTAAIRKAVDTKLWAPIFVARAALPHRARSGSITFFSGAAAYRPSAGAVVVAMVNAGLEGLAKGLAVELAPIRVNVPRLVRSRSRFRTAPIPGAGFGLPREIWSTADASSTADVPSRSCRITPSRAASSFGPRGQRANG